jgi:hypothetical protein
MRRGGILLREKIERRIEIVEADLEWYRDLYLEAQKKEKFCEKSDHAESMYHQGEKHGLEWLVKSLEGELNFLSQLLLVEVTK